MAHIPIALAEGDASIEDEVFVLRRGRRACRTVGADGGHRNVIPEHNALVEGDGIACEIQVGAVLTAAEVENRSCAFKNDIATATTDGRDDIGCHVSQVPVVELDRTLLKADVTSKTGVVTQKLEQTTAELSDAAGADLTGCVDVGKVPDGGGAVVVEEQFVKASDPSPETCGDGASAVGDQTATADDEAVGRRGVISGGLQGDVLVKADGVGADVRAIAKNSARCGEDDALIGEVLGSGVGATHVVAVKTSDGEAGVIVVSEELNI